MCNGITIPQIILLFREYGIFNHSGLPCIFISSAILNKSGIICCRNKVGLVVVQNPFVCRSVKRLNSGLKGITRSISCNHHPLISAIAHLYVIFKRIQFEDNRFVVIDIHVFENCSSAGYSRNIDIGRKPVQISFFQRVVS
ncbi:hypothetical protein D3C80_1252880 [compost metagenome]